jgi:hypothetical protein
MEPACSKALVNHREAYWSIVCSESRAVHFPTVGFDEHIFLAPSIGPVRNRLYVEWELIDNDFAGVEPVADGVPNIFLRALDPPRSCAQPEKTPALGTFRYAV